MFKLRQIFFVVLIGWIVLARADQEKLSEEFYSNAELYSKIDMIEQLAVLENISDKDLTMAQQTNLPESNEGDKTP